jgi:AcrR family transcriptional regulator
MSQMSIITKSEATIASILFAAASLFTARNYADVTMDQIAEACSVTKGALYHHFSSKEELYLALMHSDLGAKRALFGEAVAAGRDCRDRLRRLTAVFLGLPRQSREVARLVRRDINIFGEPARGELVRAYQSSLPELIEGVIRDGIRDGELAPADPRLLSWHFVAMVEVTLTGFADNVFDNADDKLDHVMELFFRGAGKKQGDNE